MRIKLSEIVSAIIFLVLIYFSNFYVQDRNNTTNLNDNNKSITEFSSSSLKSLQSLNETRIITKVIDGDTIIAAGGENIRLIGIDADEKDYPCFLPAKQRMEELTLNHQAELVADETDKDLYGRSLRYVFVDGQNINVEMVKEGLAVARFDQKNLKYKAQIIEAENYAIANKIGCKWQNL